MPMAENLAQGLCNCCEKQLPSCYFSRPMEICAPRLCQSVTCCLSLNGLKYKAFLVQPLGGSVTPLNMIYSTGWPLWTIRCCTHSPTFPKHLTFRIILGWLIYSAWTLRQFDKNMLRGDSQAAKWISVDQSGTEKTWGILTFPEIKTNWVTTF